MEPVQAVWMRGSQPFSHLCFSLLHATLLHFCSLPFPLFASRFCSVSGQRLIRPNPWQCLARGTGSVATALMHCGECVSVEALGRRWDSTHVIVYLPFHFQMAVSRKNVLIDILSLSLFPRSSRSSVSPMAHSNLVTCFRPRTCTMRWGEEGGESLGGTLWLKRRPSKVRW